MIASDNFKTEDILAIKKLLSAMFSESCNISHDIMMYLKNPKAPLPKSITSQGLEVNKYKTKLDKDIATFLALQQPVAMDLRMVIGCMKISNDLSHIINHMLTISKNLVLLRKAYGQEKLKKRLRKSSYLDFFASIHHTLEGSMQSFNDANTLIARGVCNSIDEILHLSRKITKDIMGQMSKKILSLKSGLSLIQIIKELERVADLSKNIAEDIIYIYEANFYTSTPFSNSSSD